MKLFDENGRRIFVYWLSQDSYSDYQSTHFYSYEDLNQQIDAFIEKRKAEEKERMDFYYSHTYKKYGASWYDVANKACQEKYGSPWLLTCSISEIVKQFGLLPLEDELGLKERNVSWDC